MPKPVPLSVSCSPTTVTAATCSEAPLATTVPAVMAPSDVARLASRMPALMVVLPR